jgi:hypothetical protein
MLIMVSGATAAVARIGQHPNLGVLLTPRNGNSVRWIRSTGLPWACDNSAFARFEPRRFLRMLSLIVGAGPLWVAAPDVVGDAAETLRRFRAWGPPMAEAGISVALVAQNGLTVDQVPWTEIRCLFIGGCTAWKLSAAAGQLIAAAKDRGVWVHVGRVNSQRRLAWCLRHNVDSVDGTSYSRWSDKYLPRDLGWLARHERPGLFCEAFQETQP